MTALGFLCCALVLQAAAPKQKMAKFIRSEMDFAVLQSMQMYDSVKDLEGRLVNTARDGRLVTCGSRDWVAGFFPGTLWYLYEYTGDPEIRSAVIAPDVRKIIAAAVRALDVREEYDIPPCCPELHFVEEGFTVNAARPAMNIQNRGILLSPAVSFRKQHPSAEIQPAGGIINPVGLRYIFPGQSVVIQMGKPDHFGTVPVYFEDFRNVIPSLIYQGDAAFAGMHSRDHTVLFPYGFTA